MLLAVRQTQSPPMSVQSVLASARNEQPRPSTHTAGKVITLSPSGAPARDTELPPRSYMTLAVGQSSCRRSALFSVGSMRTLPYVQVPSSAPPHASKLGQV